MGCVPAKRTPLRDVGRWLTLLFARLLLGRAKPGGAIEAPRKVLVIRTDERVGNVLLTTPLLRALRRGLPDAEIVLLHAASKTSLVHGLPSVDRLVPFEKKAFFRSPLRFWRQLRDLRAERFDLVIEAGHWHAFSLTAALLTLFLRPRASIGHDRGPAADFFTHPVPPPAGEMHDVTVKLSLLRPLALPDAGMALETPLAHDRQAIAAMEGTLREMGADPARLLVVNPGARMSVRRWSPERLGAAAAEIARTHDLRAVVIWGPGEEALAEEVVRHVGEGAVLAPPTDLGQLAALFSLARLVLTNDTGPMHLAVACDAPTVGIFLATDPARWGHRLPHFTALNPAALEGEGAVDAVLQAADRLLSSTVDLRSSAV